MLRWTTRRRHGPPVLILTVLCILLGLSNGSQKSAALRTVDVVDSARLAVAASANGATPAAGGENWATGKLNQFKGFYTPRPLPPNAQLTYSSVWASWSAWSFCVSHEQIRVRACNTVRGFSCLGPNRETKPCDLEGDAPLTPPTPVENRPRNVGDYDIVDPWAEDRSEALHQLYDLPHSIKSNVPRSREFSHQRSAGHTFQINQGYGGGRPQAPPVRTATVKVAQGPPKAPSMTPELLFGSKLEIPKQPINSTSTQSQSLNVMNAVMTATVKSTTITASSTVTEIDLTTAAVSSNTINAGEDSEKLLNNKKSTAMVAGSLLPADTVLTDDAAARQLFGNDAANLNAGPGQKSTAQKQQLNGGGASSDTLNSLSEMSVPSSLAVGGSVEKNVLHSGEVVYPKDERITLETARAFEWMIANMSRAAEAELSLNSHRRGTVHSGEMILSQHKDSDEFDPVQSDSLPPSLRHHSGNEIRRKEPIRAHASRQWAPPSGKFGELSLAALSESKHGVDKSPSAAIHNNSVGIRSRVPGDNALSDTSAEKLERDLLKIQSVMRQIERELETLKLAENEIDAANAALDRNALQQQRKAQQELHDKLEKQQKQSTQLQGQRRDWQRGRQDGSVRSLPLPVSSLPPLGIDLVPTLEPRTIAVKSTTTTPIKESEILLIQGIGDGNVNAEWSDWRPWADCFCSRKVRTRVCKYDATTSTKGCPGRSYETRPCVSLEDKCPARRTSPVTAPPSAQPITPEFYTLAPPRVNKRHEGAAFHPSRLAVASLSTNGSQ